MEETTPETKQMQHLLGEKTLGKMACPMSSWRLHLPRSFPDECKSDPSRSRAETVRDANTPDSRSKNSHT